MNKNLDSVIERENEYLKKMNIDCSSTDIEKYCADTLDILKLITKQYYKGYVNPTELLREQI